MRNAVRDSKLRLFADALDGFGGMDRNRSVAAAAADRNGINRRTEPLCLLAYAQIARDHQHGYVIQRSRKGIDDQFARLNAVDADGHIVQIHRMGERVGVRVGRGMVAGEDGAGEAGVDARHHGMDVTAPAAEDAHALGKLGGNQVARAVVRILDEQVFTACGECAFAGGGDLAGHLMAERLIIRLAQLSFVPVGDAAGALNIGGEKNAVQHENQALS